MIFFTSESASITIVRRYGWGPKNERLVDASPWGHWKTTTLVAGLRTDGLVAPMVLDGPRDRPAFRAYAEQACENRLSSDRPAAPGDD